MPYFHVLEITTSQSTLTSQLSVMEFFPLPADCLITPVFLMPPHGIYYHPHNQSVWKLWQFATFPRMRRYGKLACLPFPVVYQNSTAFNGPQICLPYLDPALFQARHQILELTYGFRCRCPSCKLLETIGHIPEPPEDPGELVEVARALRAFVGIGHSAPLTLPSQTIHEKIPHQLLCAFHESYLANLSETFSKTSHAGQYDIACDVGLTLLALYVIIYPPNYPLIG